MDHRPHRLHRLAPALVAALALGLATVPSRAAHASGGTIAGALIDVMALSAATGVGLATDIGLGISLGTTGYAPLLLSLGSAGVWVLTSALYLSMLDPSGELNGLGVGLGILCAGSLGLSVYGMTRTPPPVAVTPVALRDRHGDPAPGLALTVHW